ncbi:hypothetical protein DUNSADRAFT_5165 [Dunaliella salina]|uniref:Encoded protein n=1 Tax=Dunaliella salina TaxID=3046 RepID=A0ABQ7H7G4_DUNSA|nr:hypothetical protein DUNSADRAFT_5165 [Dunaliella salina]|eukprot:KAF5842793.1 hypothetical protein DUNSADRAFT_5165 [Dunaliella salina]
MKRVPIIKSRSRGLSLFSGALPSCKFDEFDRFPGSRPLDWHSFMISVTEALLHQSLTRSLTMACLSAACFQYSGTPGKRHRMREFMLWEDPPSYFDHPKGFINLRVDIPHELLANASGQNLKYTLTATQTDSHFNLVNHQLLHIRAGVALAQLTGRVLIMPPIWCELDKYWATLEYGSIPGSIFKRPFICPMDHVFEIENGWAPDRPYGFPEDQVGPKVEWREYSFLENPALPKSVRDSRLKVEVCPHGKLEGCNDGTAPASVQGNSIHVRPGLNSDQILKALEHVTHHKILDFKHVDRLWPKYSQAGGWFTDPAAHQRFVKRIQFMPSVICCLNMRPGWMWYDMQWDVPHTDRFGRWYDSWHLKMGDNGDVRPPRVRRRRSRQLLTSVTEGEGAGHPVQQVPSLQHRLQGQSPL